MKEGTTMKAIAVCSVSNTMGIELYEYNGEVALAAAVNMDKADRPRVYKVNYTTAGRPYIRMMGGRQYLDDFMRV